MAVTSSAPAQIVVHIRWMIRRDMPGVLAIEHGSGFECPWCEEDFLRVLRQRNCIGMVAEYRGQITGFMVYELHETDIHLLTLVVHPNCQRAGIGRQMIGKLIRKLSKLHRKRLTTSVREANLEGQLFLRSQGWLAKGIIRGQDIGSREDSYVFAYEWSPDDGDHEV